MAYDMLGNLLAEFGRFDEAYDYLARAIALAPLMAGTYYDLVRCRPVTTNDDGLLARMAEALGTPGLDVAQRLRVHLALGKAADDLGDYALAMHHFDAAGAVRRGSMSFDSPAFDTQIDRLIDRFTPDLIARTAELGSGDATPVLIVGMPRSGTTLVEQIVSSHPDVAAGGELTFWTECGAAWHKAGPAATEATFQAQAAADYLGLLRAIGPKAARVTGKMPFNFLWAGLIHLAFPHATIIHCRRAAIDTALSIHQTHFHPALAFPTGGAKLVAYFRGYRRVTDHWRRILPAEQFIEIDYEDLTHDPEPLIRRIIASCGLPWDIVARSSPKPPTSNANLDRTARFCGRNVFRSVRDEFSLGGSVCAIVAAIRAASAQTASPPAPREHVLERQPAVTTNHERRQRALFDQTESNESCVTLRAQRTESTTFGARYLDPRFGGSL